VTPLFWMLPPLLYRSQVPGLDKEQAYILAAQSVLPPGVLGLMFAAMFSATASMVSSQLNVFAGVLTNDFYRPLINPQASEKRLVGMGRFFTALLGAFLVIAAILVPRLGGAENLIISVNSLLVVPLFAPTLWGLFSRKISIRDMLIVALTSFGIGLVLRFGLAENPAIHAQHPLWPIASFLGAHSQNIEVIIGVVLPLLMLIGFELAKKTTDPGAERVATHVAAAQTTQPSSTDATRPFDPFPARMVMISLIVMGAWLGVLSINIDQGATTLRSFSAVLLIAATTIRHFIRRRLRRPTS